MARKDEHDVTDQLVPSHPPQPASEIDGEHSWTVGCGGAICEYCHLALERVTDLPQRGCLTLAERLDTMAANPGRWMRRLLAKTMQDVAQANRELQSRLAAEAARASALLSELQIESELADREHVRAETETVRCVALEKRLRELEASHEQVKQALRKLVTEWRIYAERNKSNPTDNWAIFTGVANDVSALLVSSAPLSEEKKEK